MSDRPAGATIIGIGFLSFGIFGLLGLVEALYPKTMVLWIFTHRFWLYPLVLLLVFGIQNGAYSFLGSLGGLCILTAVAAFRRYEVDAGNLRPLATI